MQTILKIIFFIPTVFALIYEVSNILHPNKVNRMTKRITTTKFELLASGDKTNVFMLFCYFVWGLIGVFSSQWIIFLVLIVLGLITAKIKQFSPVRVIDGIISFVLLSFAAINAFHLHINLLDLLIGFFAQIR